jgi:hypothetical protein
MSETPNRPQSIARTGVVVIAGLFLLTLTIAGLGCAKPSTSNWAQTSPVMNADTTTNSVNLGARD